MNVSLYYIRCWFYHIGAGVPSRLGQDILFEIPGRISWNSLLWRQDIQGRLSTLHCDINPLVFSFLKFPNYRTIDVEVNMFILTALRNGSIVLFACHMAASASGNLWKFSFLFKIEQGGNDFEIFESAKTIGHTGQIYMIYFMSLFCHRLNASPNLYLGRVLRLQLWLSLAFWLDLFICYQ